MYLCSGTRHYSQMTTYDNNKSVSQTITWMRFPLIFLIIMLHCYSVQRLEGNHEEFFKVIYPFSLWLGETGVPAFFFISGYLFYLSTKTYLQKLRTRLHTLLIPYLLWNILLLCFYLIAYAFGFPQYINHKSIVEFKLIDYIRLFWDRGSIDEGNFVPLLCPLWYIRNLLVMSLLSPIFYYIIRYVREFFIITVSIWWMTTYNNAFIPQTILFFSLGAYFSILEINPLEFFIKRKVLFTTLFAITAIGDIATHGYIENSFSLQFHRLSLIFNIPALFMLADWCVRHGYTSKRLPNAAFIVFCVHYPIVVLLRKNCIARFCTAPDSVHIVLYFLCIIISTLLSLGIYMVMNRYIPRAKNILSGSR